MVDRTQLMRDYVREVEARPEDPSALHLPYGTELGNDFITWATGNTATIPGQAVEWATAETDNLNDPIKALRRIADFTSLRTSKHAPRAEPSPADILIFGANHGWPHGALALHVHITDHILVFAQGSIMGRPTYYSLHGQGLPQLLGWWHLRDSAITRTTTPRPAPWEVNR